MKRLICKLLYILTKERICLGWCSKNCKFEKSKQMARKVITSAFKSVKKKRKGVHSKNASKGQNGFTKAYRGQGR